MDGSIFQISARVLWNIFFSNSFLDGKRDENVRGWKVEQSVEEMEEWLSVNVRNFSSRKIRSKIEISP